MREFWDERYRAEGYIFGIEPNRFLASQASLLAPGQRALAIADGEGRNGVWLAQQGLDVVSTDISPVAVEKARTLAESKGVQVDFRVCDIREWVWPNAEFDVVAAIFIQFATPDERPAIFHGLKRALRPGGHLILQGYTPQQVEYKTGGPSQPENMYTATMLSEAFGDMDILHLREHEEIIEEGTHHSGRSALIDLVARKRPN